MTRRWDIVADVFPGTEVVERKRLTRLPIRVPTSAVIAWVLVISIAVPGGELSAGLIAGVSDGSVTMSRERVELPLKPARAPAIGHHPDFHTARSAEQLAKAFQLFFAPASDFDEEDQVPFVFG